MIDSNGHDRVVILRVRIGQTIVLEPNHGFRLPAFKDALTNQAQLQIVETQSV